LQIDRREINMAVILATLEHNLRTAYPRLLQSPGGSNMIYPSNLDDHFRLTRLSAALADGPPLQAAIEALAKHLEAIPGPEN
jgi:hypothetical protein